MSNFEAISSFVTAKCQRNAWVEGLLALAYSFMVFHSWTYFTRLWLLGSKFSYRKKAFLFMVIASFVRVVWYACSTLFDMASSGEEGIDFGTLTSFYMYYWPTVLLFQASCQMVLNWFQLYQKEKLRRKLDMPVHFPAQPALHQHIRRKFKKFKNGRVKSPRTGAGATPNGA
eukprot:CAMPEP_0119135858 /NCGR_PEP_ID=MMETSP1310-20130426/20202_1 /TAXON_ID=464262 /ORGANISM="Genus nov. species nov., Strain RCC2339" /LENGTH=171 /DNA_ID=CAMNT_0007126803 /DNA_START=13 /DNA_END=524 /DNA_ORIENTATION=+